MKITQLRGYCAMNGLMIHERDGFVLTRELTQGDCVAKLYQVDEWGEVKEIKSFIDPANDLIYFLGGTI